MHLGGNLGVMEANCDDSKALSSFIRFCGAAAILFRHRLHSSKTLKSCSFMIQSNVDGPLSTHLQSLCFAVIGTLVAPAEPFASFLFFFFFKREIHRAPNLKRVFGSIVRPQGAAQHTCPRCCGAFPPPGAEQPRRLHFSQRPIRLQRTSGLSQLRASDWAPI